MNEREQAISNLRAAITEGRLIRKEWHREENGRHLVCLYYALAGSSDTGTCPSWLMPKWLAYMTPWIDDAGTEANWPAVIEKYADLAGRWHVLTPEAWTRLDYKCRRVAVAFSRKYAEGDAACLSAIDTVLALLDRAISGDTPTDAEWAAARAAAWDAARAAARDAASDEIIDGILAAIEGEIIEAEGATHDRA